MYKQIKFEVQMWWKFMPKVNVKDNPCQCGVFIINFEHIPKSNVFIGSF